MADSSADPQAFLFSDDSVPDDPDPGAALIDGRRVDQLLVCWAYSDLRLAARQYTEVVEAWRRRGRVLLSDREVRNLLGLPPHPELTDDGVPPSTPETFSLEG